MVSSVAWGGEMSSKGYNLFTAGFDRKILGWQIIFTKENIPHGKQWDNKWEKQWTTKWDFIFFHQSSFFVKMIDVLSIHKTVGHGLGYCV